VRAAVWFIVRVTMPTPCRLAVTLACAALLGGLAAPAASRRPEDGQSAARSARQGVYTRAQADRGKKIFAQRCASCHPLETFTEPVFLATWKGQTAHDLFTSIRTTMPQESPGALPRQEYADVLAYLLQLNKLPPGTDELAATDDALKKVLIEPPAK
jgi:S-disulfanyl-L-cysteine oxidoreductase SoxD